MSVATSSPKAKIPEPNESDKSVPDATTYSARTTKELLPNEMHTPTDIASGSNNAENVASINSQMTDTAVSSDEQAKNRNKTLPVNANTENVDSVENIL